MACCQGLCTYSMVVVPGWLLDEEVLSTFALRHAIIMNTMLMPTVYALLTDVMPWIELNTRSTCAGVVVEVVYVCI